MLLTVIMSFLLSGCGNIADSGGSNPFEETEVVIQKTESNDVKVQEDNSASGNAELDIKISLDVLNKKYSDIDAANCDVYECYNFITDSNGNELIQPYANVSFYSCEDIQGELTHAPSIIFINHSDHAAVINDLEITAVWGSGGRSLSNILNLKGMEISGPADLEDIYTNLVYSESYINDNLDTLIQTFKLDDTHEITLIGYSGDFGSTYYYIYDVKNKNAIFNYISNYNYYIPDEYKPEGVYAEVVDDIEIEREWEENNNTSFIVGDKKLTFVSEQHLLNIEGDTNYKINDNTYSVTDMRFEFKKYSWTPYGLSLWEIDAFNDSAMKWTGDIRKNSPYWFDLSSEFLTVVEENDNCIIYTLEENPKDDRINNTGGYTVFLKKYGMFIQCWTAESTDLVNELVEWLPEHLTVEEY